MANDRKDQPGAPSKNAGRVDVEMPVRISTIDPEYEARTGRPYFRTSTETSANLSPGGAFVQTHEAIEPGKRLLVELDLPDGRSIQTIGKVVWRKSTVQTSRRLPGTGIGIEFVGAAPDQLRTLERFLARQRPGATRRDDGSEPDGSK